MKSLTLNRFSLSLLFSFVSLIFCAQPLVSIDGTTVNIATSYTINSGDTYTVTGMVKNVGTTSFTNNVHVNVAIDTSSFAGVPKYYWRTTKTYSAMSMSLSATFPFAVTDVASTPNGYKTSGGGVTVVIWTSVGIVPNDSTTTKDSVFTTLYILPLPQSINEFDFFEKNPIYFNNPVTSMLYLSYEPTTYTSIELEDTYGKFISKIDSYTLNVSNYSKGIYYLKCHSANTTITKKIIIN